MAGLIDVGNDYRSKALSGMQRLSDMEIARKNEEKQLDAADAADRKSNIMGGAAMGAFAGGMGYGASLGLVGGPVGFAVGAIGGALLGSLF